MIAVVGSIQTSSWDDKDGKRQYSTEVVVDEAYFTGSRAETGTQQNGGNYANQGFVQPQPPQPAFNAPQNGGMDANFGNEGFNTMDFANIDDGSEDDLPF